MLCDARDGREAECDRMGACDFGRQTTYSMREGFAIGWGRNRLRETDCNIGCLERVESLKSRTSTGILINSDFTKTKMACLLDKRWSWGGKGGRGHGDRGEEEGADVLLCVLFPSRSAASNLPQVRNPSRAFSI